MIGTGTILNTVAVVAGGVIGRLCGSRLKERHRDTLMTANGVCVMFIGMAGGMEGMLSIEGQSLKSGQSMLLVISIALGALIGEIIDIEDGFERFGAWLKQKTGNADDAGFINAFVTASLTVCIGAMAVVGAIEDGIAGDYSILAVKSLLDFIIIMVMTCSLGKGCIFSAIPILIFEGAMTLLASLLKPFMTDLAMANLSLVGSVLIFCIGLNIVWGKKVRVANLLPALVIAVIAAFLPI